jgi:hypothetical protein
VVDLSNRVIVAPRPARLGERRSAILSRSQIA